ncbi:MAG: porin family protein [Telluria sp.]
MIKQLIAAAALAGVAAVSHAAEPATSAAVSNPFYVGLDGGATKLEHSGDGTRGSYGAFAGYNLNSTFAVEAGFRRLYTWDGWGAHDQTNQTSLSLIGTLPLTPSLGIYGRVGVNQLSRRGDWTGMVLDSVQKFSYKDRTTHSMYGLGASYKLTDKVSARVEVQRPGLDLTNYSAGVSYAF